MIYWKIEKSKNVPVGVAYHATQKLERHGEDRDQKHKEGRGNLA